MKVRLRGKQSPNIEDGGERALFILRTGQSIEGWPGECIVLEAMLSRHMEQGQERRT